MMNIRKHLLKAVYCSVCFSLAVGCLAAGNVTLQQLELRNIVKNSLFQPTGDGTGIASWGAYPQGTTLVRTVQTEDSTYVLEMAQGANSLAVTADAVKVSAGKSYTLAFDLKQEDIHIGFGMGARIILIWIREEGGPIPEILDTVDGSFDWDTLAYSVKVPEGVKAVRIRLMKRGSPGRIWYRNIVLGEGVLVKNREDLSLADWVRTALSAEFLLNRIQVYFADKPALNLAKVGNKKAELQAAIQSFLQTLQKEMPEKVREGFDKERSKVQWTEMLKGTVGFRLPPAFPHYSELDALNSQVDELFQLTEQAIRQDNRKHLETAMRESLGQYRGYAVGVDSPMLKLRRDAAYTGRVSNQVNISLARNEEESAQITLAALDRDLKNVRLEVSELRSSTGEVLSAEQVSIWRIDFVKTNPPQYYAGPVGWWPDVVFPAQTVEQISQGENQAFWVTLAPSAETQAGDYSGEFHVYVEDQLHYTLPLQVRVWDLTLPRPGKFEVVGCFHPYMLRDFYRWDKIKDEVIAEWNRFIVRKRWNPTLYFSTSITPSGKALQAAIDEGLNAINLIDPSKFLDRDESRTYSWPTEEQEKNIKEALLKAKSDFLEAGGDSRTKLYMAGFDEQHDRAQYKLMRHVFELAKQVVPEAKVMTTTTYPPLDELAGAVDTWVPLLGSESEDLLARQAAGDELHFYVYAHPFRPYPNPSLIDYPGVDGRVTFWLASAKGYTGFLHYLFNGWRINNQLEGPRWPETDWLPYGSDNQKARNGSGYFIYPGPNEQPVASVRMEHVRDGIEEWEMLLMLKDHIQARANDDSELTVKARQVLESAQRLTPALDQYTMDMDELMAMRTAVAEVLVELEQQNP